ncbi:hypothetical protein [Paraburkholderia guartelaensis]|uniref:hypothetical protein n=1 Tax=Paraburkholderia guartelaensis TaxID=2546446 RepID=UPI002AB64982|nr:hypothetical protein [Paraburkholderia guartelaensis]
MSPFSINFGGDTFWESLAVRVQPYLGPVDDTLGEFWREHVAGGFSRADFTVVLAASQFAGKAPGWYVLKYETANGTTEAEPLLAGESRAHCIACLLEQFREDGASANVIHDAQHDRTVFLREDRVFATVYPVPDRRSVTDAVRRRVEGTFVGLRKGHDVQKQLARRLSDWPGITRVQAREAGDAKSGIHWPCPAEWLLSARELLVKSGREPGTSSAQALAAAIFDLKSWHQLCGLLQRRAEKSDWWSLYSPYRVHTEGSGNGVTNGVLADPVSAFLEFRALAAKAIGTAGMLESHLASDKAGFPALVLMSPPDKHRSDRATPTTLALDAVPQPPIDPDLIEHVLLATHTNYIGGLANLLKN